tara:strand:+ start:270 stop:581 length:312 start_codon:yes stop_codon:yes gene_type:complete
VKDDKVMSPAEMNLIKLWKAGDTLDEAQRLLESIQSGTSWDTNRKVEPTEAFAREVMPKLIGANSEVLKRLFQQQYEGMGLCPISAMSFILDHLSGRSLEGDK